MKKAVVILIAIIFVVSIALVNFLGVKSKSFDQVVYTQSLEITNDGLQDVEEKGEIMKGIVLRKDTNGERKFQIQYKVTPDSVTKPGVVFSYDTQKSFVTVSEDGLVTFTKPGSITVTIKPIDGSNCQAKIKITFLT